MINVIKVNGDWLPTPGEDLTIKDEKIKTESESEAGTTLVIVTRISKLEISGKWNLSGQWMRRFRQYRNADSVTVGIYYPDPYVLSEYECQFEITGETHLTNARHQLPAQGGLYEVDVNIKEL